MNLASVATGALPVAIHITPKDFPACRKAVNIFKTQSVAPWMSSARVILWFHSLVKLPLGEDIHCRRQSNYTFIRQLACALGISLSWVVVPSKFLLGLGSLAVPEVVVGLEAFIGVSITGISAPGAFFSGWGVSHSFSNISSEWCGSLPQSPQSL